MVFSVLRDARKSSNKNYLKIGLMYFFICTKLKSITWLLERTILLLLLLCGQANAQNNYTFIGSYNTSNGVPNYLDTRESLSSEFVKRISASLPEKYPVPSYNPQYITTQTQTNIELVQESDVWVTFVSEGAGYMNVLGYYTYNTSNPSTTMPINSEIKIIFPNVSAQGSGGGLIAGDRVKLGTFPAGTGIGWVLLANAWKGGTTGVGTPNWKLFSNPLFNPEAAAALKYHNVLLYDNSTSRIVLGFEDIRRDNTSCDNDFNDAIFYITASTNAAIVLTNINTTSEVGARISSGYEGGLESDGSLAEKITSRNVKKDLINKDAKKIALYNPKSITSFPKLISNENTQGLASYFPIYGNDSTTAIITTPTDLLNLTNAVEVLSTDYLKSTDRTSVILATKTISEVYSHTKSICDRVAGGSISSVYKVHIGGKYPANLMTIKRNNMIEYAVSFSMRNMTDSSFEYHSHWNVTDFPTGKDYYNFQLWGKTPADVFFLSEEVLKKFEETELILDSLYYSPLPPLMMKSGGYVQGKFKISVMNPTKKVGVLTVAGTLRPAEQSSSVLYHQIVYLDGSTSQDFILNTNGVFDAGIIVSLHGESFQDNVYLADGSWVANYEPINVSNTQLTIFPQDALPSNTDKYWVERGFAAAGNVKNYYSVHRTLRLGLNPVNLTNYNFLSFTGSGSGQLELVISTDSISNWNNQARINIVLSENAKEYSIDLNNVLSNNGMPLGKSNITALTFSSIGNNVDFAPFNIKINQIAFSKINDCDDNKDVVATAYSIEKYESQGVMKVNNVNKALANVSVSATNAIEFSPGFTAEAGTVFKAEIKTCQNVRY
jgi:hypothetical protein